MLKDKYPDKMRVVYFAESTEGKRIPLVIVNKYGVFDYNDMNKLGLNSVLINANIHAGEIEGKEAVLILLREILEGKQDNMLNNQVLLFIPIFNPDGNDKMAKGNRRDNGPEIVGVRHNGQGLDINRDYIKLETPEARGMIRIFNQWDPVLYVDMHTTDGSYHQEPVTYAQGLAPQQDKRILNYMWNNLFTKVSKRLKNKYGFKSIPYGNFVDRKDPTKGWRNHAYKAMFGICYYSLRNRFSILNENYSHADYKTRVYASLGFIKSILEYTSENINEMREIARKADIDSINKVANSKFGVKFKVKKTFDFVINSYVFKVEKIKKEDLKKYPPWFGGYLIKRTEKLKSYRLPLFASFESVKFVNLTEGYLILPSEIRVVNLLNIHGIIVKKIEKPMKLRVKEFVLKKIIPSKQLYQGHYTERLEGEEILKELLFPKGSYFVSLRQPLSRLAAYILEPLSEDGATFWNFFDRVLVKQWGGRLWKYPVYKVLSKL